MTDVFRELTIKYKGETVTFSPNMQMLGRLRTVARGAGTSFIELARSIQTGQPDNWTLAYVLQQFLAAGGHEVGEDECYQFLQSGGGGSALELQEFYTAYLNATFPEVDAGKKPAPRAQKATKKPTKAKT